MLPDIDAATASMPEVGMDAIVATLTHDLDNDVGLDVRNDIGQKWHTMGDGHASDPVTHEHVVEAVQLGINDIQHAHALSPTLDEKKVETDVRAATPAPAKAGQPKYGPEQVMPRLDPESKENGQLGWKQPDFATLWKAPIRSGQTPTYGDKILESMAGGDFGKQLKNLGNLFPEEQDVAHGINTLHPRAGYTEGFLKDLKDPTKTQQKLQEIIDYDPGKGVNATDEDNATTADIERLQQQGVDAQQAGDKKSGKDSRLKGLTLQQRFEYIHNLESYQGKGTSDLEQDEIIELFQTASWDDRRVLFKMLEHREWEGKLKGWKAWGDDVWSNLDHDHILRFERMMDS